VLYNALVATLNPGDEVIIPRPIGELSGDGAAGGASRERSKGKIPNHHGNRLQDDGRGARARDHAEDQVLILNSPSNPTGSAYTKSSSRR